MSKQTESKGIEESAKKIDNPNDATELIKKMVKMIKNNNIENIGKIFKKTKANNKFIRAVIAFKISKKTINFKIDIVKFIYMYPKMQIPCIFLYYLKNNFRVIKEVCQEHASEFQ